MARLSYAEETKQERRLHILSILQKVGMELGHRSLQSALRERLCRVGEDVLKAELSWLADLDLITCEDLGDGVMVATLTARGAEVADGITVVPGVKRRVAWE